MNTARLSLLEDLGREIKRSATTISPRLDESQLLIYSALRGTSRWWFSDNKLWRREREKRQRWCLEACWRAGSPISRREAARAAPRPATAPLHSPDKHPVERREPQDRVFCKGVELMQNGFILIWVLFAMLLVLPPHVSCTGTQRRWLQFCLRLGKGRSVLILCRGRVRPRHRMAEGQKSAAAL